MGNISIPNPELFLSVTNKDEYEIRHKNSIGSMKAVDFPAQPHAELTWSDSPGYGYSNKKANEFLSNRYKRGLPTIRLTLIRLRKSPEFQSWVTSNREDGYLDWQILISLANRVMNYRLHKTMESFTLALGSLGAIGPVPLPQPGTGLRTT